MDTFIAWLSDSGLEWNFSALRYVRFHRNVVIYMYHSGEIRFGSKKTSNSRLFDFFKI